MACSALVWMWLYCELLAANRVEPALVAISGVRVDADGDDTRRGRRGPGALFSADDLALEVPPRDDLAVWWHNRSILSDPSAG